MIIIIRPVFIITCQREPKLLVVPFNQLPNEFEVKNAIMRWQCGTIAPNIFSFL